MTQISLVGFTIHCFQLLKDCIVLIVQVLIVWLLFNRRGEHSGSETILLSHYMQVSST